MNPSIKDDFAAVQNAVNDWRWKVNSIETRQKQAALGRIAASHHDLVAALEELLVSHSMENIGLDASKRRLAAKVLARNALAKARGEPA